MARSLGVNPIRSLQSRAGDRYPPGIDARDIDGPWTNYFTAIAGASGAIFALLFVGMQVRLDVWLGKPLRIYAVALALFELAAPLIISLIVLMPDDTWRIGARIVGPIGVLAAIGHVYLYLRVRSAAEVDHQRRPPISFSDSLRVWLGSAGSLLLFGSLLLCTLTCWPCDGLASAAWICLWLVILGITESFVFLANWRVISG